MTTLPDRFAACRTAADFYRVQIDAENLLSPAEVEALEPAGLPPQAAAWLGKLRGMLMLAGGGAQAFRRRDLSDNATFYEGEGEGSPRCLVVAFTGIAMRMNVPAPAFLQALPAASCDVVILRDPGRAAFLAGVPGYAADLPALAARLAADLPGGRHPGGIRCIGTSAGGAAALYLGRLVRARRAVSVDGAHPAALKLRLPDEVDRGALDAALARTPPGPEVLVAAHGIGDLRDAVRGRLLAAGLPGARALTVAVQGPHGLFGTLLARRLLGRFLAEVLLADTPPDGLPATWPAAT
ncbi:hypothetical protein [Roseomonas sp. HF4]|uniref:hypothetical protein n=1 Tax=Roseomonas sp. HF4 TaxID=2562313 RepID=UPI0010C01006|nr:hypothetical protein [Roseomonas sp. HF4]